MYYNDFETNKQTNETKKWVSGTTTYAAPQSMTCTISSQQVTCETLANGSSLMNPDLIREVRPPTPIS